MNFSDNWVCPNNFSDIEKAQSLFLELLWHYLNNQSEVERTRKLMFSILNSEILSNIKLFDDFSATSDNHTMKQLLMHFKEKISEYEYDKLLMYNRRISDFYREI